jgi:hypothetical protein
MTFFCRGVHSVSCLCTTVGLRTTPLAKHQANDSAANDAGLVHDHTGHIAILRRKKTTFTHRHHLTRVHALHLPGVASKPPRRRCVASGDTSAHYDHRRLESTASQGSRMYVGSRGPDGIIWTPPTKSQMAVSPSTALPTAIPPYVPSSSPSQLARVRTFSTSHTTDQRT